MKLFKAVKNRVDIYNLYEDLTGNKAGTTVTCPVPGHRDNTPSCGLDRGKGLWNCLGCGAGGSVIDMVKDVKGMTALEAAKWLAENYNIYYEGLTPEDKKKYMNEQKQQQVLKSFIENCHKKLKPGHRNKLKKRGLSEEIINKYKIGYCPSIKVNKSDDKKRKLFKSIGAINKSGNFIFNNRIIIPFYKYRNPVYFVGWDDNQKDYKYLNPAGLEKPVVFYKASKEDEFYLVEGVFDYYSLVEAGKNVIAVLGSKTKNCLIKKLKQMKDKDIYIAFDGDKPGQEAAEKLAKELWPEIKAEILNLPEGRDINDLLKDDCNSDIELFKVKLEGLTGDFIIERDRSVKGGRAPVITCLNNVEPEEVEFLWKPYIPRRKLTLLEGDPGIGKTFLALQLAATVSKGYPLPEVDGILQTKAPQGNILYLSAEDGLADTLRPRLDMLEADVSKIHILQGLRNEEGEKKAISLQDIDILDRAMEKIKPLFVVVDPVQGYLGANIDMNRANEVRPVLSSIADLAEKYNSAILCIRHLTKSAQGRTLYRGMGSIDFSAAARSILLAGADPDHPEKKAMIHIKSSLSKAGPAQGYELEDGCFYWSGLSNLTAGDLLKPETDPEEKTAKEEARDLILDILQENGKYPSKDLEKEVKSLGVSKRTFRRARTELRDKNIIKSEKIGKEWYWILVDDNKDKMNNNTTQDNRKIEI